MARSFQIRRLSSQFYVVIRCTARKCDSTWRSGYFNNRKEAEQAIARYYPARPRCLMHRRDAVARYLSGRTNVRPRAYAGFARP